jgi:hypothetical protein
MLRTMVKRFAFGAAFASISAATLTLSGGEGEAAPLRDRPMVRIAELDIDPE